MSLKYFKSIFILIVLIFIILGVYLIYIKNDGGDIVISRKKEIETSKEICIGITEYDTINPISTKSLEIQYITRLVYEPLINITQDFNIEAAIAEEWSKLDNSTYIIKLDETKKWQNGEKIKIEDIIYTINKIRDSDSIYKENVKAIEKVEKVNESTLKMHLKEEVEFFEYFLCFPIIKEETYNDDIPLGTGKYIIQNIKDNEIILKNQDSKLIVKIYNSISELYNGFTREKVDLIITQNTEYADYIGNIGFSETIITGREFYYISCENIESVDIRRYIKENINKEKIVYELYNQKYCIADFPLEYGSYLNKKTEVNKKGKIIKKETYTLSTQKENYEIAKKIKEDLEEKDIKINLQKHTNSKADLILKKQIVPITPTIDRYFNNEDTKMQIKTAIQIENKNILKQEYEKIIDNYYEEVPFISLFFNSYIVLHNDRLKGNFTGNWYNIFYNIDSWYKVI